MEGSSGSRPCSSPGHQRVDDHDRRVRHGRRALPLPDRAPPRPPGVLERTAPAAIRAAIWGSGFEDEGERGRLSADEYLAGFGERLGYALSTDQWVEARRVAIEPDAAVLELARRIGARQPVGLFTNNPLLLKRHLAMVFPEAADIFGPRAVFSSELGRTKPAPEAFHGLAARLGVAPREILYFDDDASYVAGARAAGLSAEQVGGEAGVRAGLAAYGVQCPEITS